MLKTPRFVNGLFGARYGRLHCLRGGPTAASKRGGHDYSHLDVHAHRGTSLRNQSAENEGERGGASM